jgi:hypothetical protein
MSKLRQLRAVSPPQRVQLLRKLYEAAQETESAPGYAKDVVKESRKNRRYRLRFTRLLPKLKNALASIKEVDEKDGALILEIENEYMGHRPEKFGTLEEAIKHLEALIRTAKDLEGLGAYLVHPDKRTKPEKKLVTERWNVIRLYIDSSDKQSGYLARGQFKALDGRLVSKAMKILDRFRTVNGRKIPSYHVIITKVFDVALGEVRSEESTRKMLDRIKKHKTFTSTNSVTAKIDSIAPTH